jgi:hypothetical protein
MKLRTSIVALIVGFSPAAVWAGAATDPVQDAQEAHQGGAAENDSANTNAKASNETADARPGAANTSDESAGWQYMNGRAMPSEGETESDQAASDEMRAEQVAIEEIDEMADSQASGDDQSATGDSTASADDVMGNEQEFMANLPDSRRDDSATMGLQGIPGGVEDKLVVILPRDWQGSLPDLIAALEQTSEATEILVLKREGQSDDMSSENSEDADTSDSSTQ